MFLSVLALKAGFLGIRGEVEIRLYGLRAERLFLDPIDYGKGAEIWLFG